jgi:hypothetical protein
VSDFILNVRRGGHQSFEFEVYQDEAQTITENVSDAGTSVVAFFAPPNAATASFTKTCRKVTPTQGLVALDLTPAESRALLARMDVELQLRTATREDIVAYGKAYARGGINTDV